MKTKTLLLLAAILVLVIAAACNDDPAANGEETPCTLGAHLGIGETCSGTSCTLQDYRTPAQAASFPKPIYRYGKTVNYTAEELRNTADGIIAAFEAVKDLSNAEEYNAIMAAIARLCVTQAANNRYTWDGETLGADPDTPSVVDYMGARIPRVIEANPMYPLAQADHASDIIVQ